VVTIPTTATNGDSSVTTLTLTGTGGAVGTNGSDTSTTTVETPVITVTKQVRNVTDGGSFADTATAAPTEILEYRIRVETTSSLNATSVRLTDNDGDYTTYVAGSIYIGPNGTASTGGGNVHQSDDTSDATNCGAVETCGYGSVDGSGNLTAFLGSGATESAGGTLSNAAPVYVYFQVTVD